jgi:type IV pilus assembly protein PilW
MQNGKLYNLGATPKVLAYAVRDGNLTVCDYRLNDCSKTTSGFWTPIANNIVGMRAQYGRDRTSLMDGIVDFWDATKNPTETCGVTADNTGWLRISAVRIALVARNSQPEKTAVTAAAPIWMGTTEVVGVSASAPIDVSDAPRAAGFDWDQYRYRVFETVVPLRNITTLGAISGC